MKPNRCLEGAGKAASYKTAKSLLDLEALYFCMGHATGGPGGHEPPPHPPSTFFQKSKKKNYILKSSLRIKISLHILTVFKFSK